MLVFSDSAYLPPALTYHHRILCVYPWILYGNIKWITIKQQMLQCQWADNLQRIEFHCVVSQTECAAMLDSCVFAYGSTFFPSPYSFLPFVPLALALHIIRNKNKQTKRDRTEKRSSVVTKNLSHSRSILPIFMISVVWSICVYFQNGKWIWIQEIVMLRYSFIFIKCFFFSYFYSLPR